MAKGVAMSMSLLGMITEPTLKMDRALAWFFASRKNQCTVIREVESYVWIKEIHQGTRITPEAFCDLVAEGLQRVMVKYFDEAYVDGAPKSVSAAGNVFTCYLKCTAIENGKQYDLAHSVLINNKTFELIDKARHGTKGTS